MTSLIDLPKELIIWIADFLGPVDCYNFAIICKYISDTLFLIIKKHQAMFRKYTRIAVNAHPFLWNLVCDIIKDPFIGQYIRSLVRGFEYDSGEWTDGELMLGTSKPSKEQIESILGAAHRDPILRKRLQNTNLANTFTSELRDGELGPVIAVFLTLLPELRYLAYIDPVITEAINMVLNGPPDVSYSKLAPSSTLLSKLNNISISHWDATDGVPLRTATSLMFLPAVRTFEGFAIYGKRLPDGPHQIIDLTGTLKTYVEYVSFESSYIAHELIKEWLACTVALKGFSYDHWSYRDYTHFHPRFFAKYLLEYTAETLELMHLTDEDVSGEMWNVNEDGPLPSPISLVSFKRLKCLRCDISVFRRDPDSKLDREQRDSKDDKEDDSWRYFLPFDLTSMLPPTLTELELNRVSENDMITIKKFAQSKKKKFPLLEKFYINWSPFEEDHE